MLLLMAIEIPHAGMLERGDYFFNLFIRDWDSKEASLLEWSCGRAVTAPFLWSKSSEFDPSFGHQCWGDFSMNANFHRLYVFNAVYASIIFILLLLSLFQVGKFVLQYK